jgi:hypothetical protein
MKPNVLQWLEAFCPNDVVPKILAFAGPQKTTVLSKTNRHWNGVMKKESTWRVLCKELNKTLSAAEMPTDVLFVA